MLFFTISNLKSAITCKSRRVPLSSKIVYSGISKLLLQFPNSFHMLCTILSIVNFHTVPFMFLFLFLLTALESRYCPSSNSFLFRKSLIIGHLNVPAATAENEEQYTFSNIIYIGFQNSYSFFEVFFAKQLFLKGRQIKIEKQMQ